MKITDLDDKPLIEVPFLNAGKGPGMFYNDRLPVHWGRADQLPEDLDGLIFTADLQGRADCGLSQNAGNGRQKTGSPYPLLGEVLPQILVNQVLNVAGLTDARRIGVVLAGDFYTVPNLDKRGGSGDVTTVWQAFGDIFRWVVGVAGNHDMFQESAAPTSLARNMRYLDGDTCELDQLRFGGVGGIVGNPKRPHRRLQDDYEFVLSETLDESLDILVMHDGPGLPDQGLKGQAFIREAIEQAAPRLVVRGHSHWRTPLAELCNGTQVLNVDARAVLVTAEPTTGSQPDAFRREDTQTAITLGGKTPKLR